MVCMNPGPTTNMRLPAPEAGLPWIDKTHAEAGFDQRLIGETRVAHAGNRAEPLQQVAIKGGDLRVFVTGFARVQLKQQQILAIESDLDGFQIRHRSDKQPGRNQHQQRQSDLPEHQSMAQADARRRRATGWPARVSFIAEITSTRVDCIAGARPNSIPVRRESAIATPSTRQFSSACRVKFSFPFASSRVRKRIPQTANKIPKQSAQRRQQNAFGQQLTDDAESSRADAKPQRNFASSRGGPRQQQIRDVGARDRQDQSHQSDQHIKRLRISPAKTVQAGRARLYHQATEDLRAPHRWMR